MSPTACYRCATLCVPAVLAGLLTLSRAAADVEDFDVDLTLIARPAAFTNSVGMKLVMLKGGKYPVGAVQGEALSSAIELPRHDVTFSKDFYVGVTEVTQKQYKAVVGSNPSHFSKDGGGRASVQGMDTDDFPVDTVSYNDAQEFLKKLNALGGERRYAVTYRLPSEAEWETACRAGTDTPYHFGKEITAKLANSEAGKLNRTCKVGSYEANKLGVYDMHGNVWEWCHDWYDGKYYATSPAKDSIGPANGTNRVIRGGGYYSNSQACRSAYRNSYPPTGKVNNVGFRVVAVP
jgi:formylglycine-generating enzyme required for sulfatase activity